MKNRNGIGKNPMEKAAATQNVSVKVEENDPVHAKCQKLVTAINENIKQAAWQGKTASFDGLGLFTNTMQLLAELSIKVEALASVTHNIIGRVDQLDGGTQKEEADDGPKLIVSG